jgi:hypothetical protein
MGHRKQTLFPVNIDEQVADLNTKKDYLEENNNRFSIPQIELATLDTEVTEVNDLHAIASNKDKRSKIDVAKRNEAIVVAQLTSRKIIDFYVVKSPNTTAVDYEALRIPTSGPFHPLPPPDYVPGIRRLESKNLAVSAEFFDAESDKRAKPEGVQSIEVCVQLGGEAPTEPAAMSERKIFTSSPIHLQFGFEDEFKFVYLVFRWVGTRGDYGPWSEIYKVVIAR